jgi:hypothetical protein
MPTPGTMGGWVLNWQADASWQYFWHKSCIQFLSFVFLTRITGDFDGKDRRRRHENGQRK